MEAHYRLLEKLYEKAPVNGFFNPTIEVSENACVIRQEVHADFFNGGKSLHGSVYFKMLDDAAYFACGSREMEYFLLTATFSISFFRPVTSGILVAEGKFIEMQESLYKGSASLRDDAGKLVAKGHGLFARSNKYIKDL